MITDNHLTHLRTIHYDGTNVEEVVDFIESFYDFHFPFSGIKMVSFTEQGDDIHLNYESHSKVDEDNNLITYVVPMSWIIISDPHNINGISCLPHFKFYNLVAGLGAN
jgi:hypothetical protein